MNQQSPIEQISTTNTIREVFGYIRRFKNQVFVLKVEDDLLDNPLFPLLIKDIVLIKNMGIKVILVPGCKNSIDKVLETYGHKTHSEKGVRITDPDIMPLVKLGASNVTNKILTLLSENDAHGVLGNWVRAIEMGVVKGVDYKNTGKIEYINIPVIRKLLEEDLIPILSNIGWNMAGKPYNISSNSLAVALAKSIGAAKLFFIGSHKGIPVVENAKVDGLEHRDSGVYSSIETLKAESLLNQHKKELGETYSELVSLALEACKNGTNRVHIIDGSQNGILLQEIFSTNGVGTMFHANIHANIRQARVSDVSGILHIMQPYILSGNMVQRTAKNIRDRLENFYVYSVDDTIRGCGALTCFENQSAEIEAVVVDSGYKGNGIGNKIVSYLQIKARELGMKQVFVLTTQAGDYFMGLGFTMASVDSLPEARKEKYNQNRNSKVLIKNFKEEHG